MAMAAGCTSEFCALVCTRLFERIRLRADPATWHGQLSFAEIAEGFKMLKLKPRINLTEEDINAMTRDGQICSEFGVLTAKEFEHMLRSELLSYVQRQVFLLVLKHIYEHGFMRERALMCTCKQPRVCAYACERARIRCNLMTN